MDSEGKKQMQIWYKHGMNNDEYMNSELHKPCVIITYNLVSETLISNVSSNSP